MFIHLFCVTGKCLSLLLSGDDEVQTQKEKSLFLRCEMEGERYGVLWMIEWEMQRLFWGSKAEAKCSVYS